MLDEYKLVSIKGHPGVYRFMDVDGNGDGPLTTEEDFANFVEGYAHVFPNGEIMRYGEVIGHRDTDLVEVIEAKS